MNARSNMEKADVALRGIAIRYGSTVPVRDLSLDVAGGEFLSLLGPSGCGKTSTLRAIAGFNALEAGDIAIAGRSVGDVPPNRRNIGMVYQDYALFPHLTVAENIAFGLRMRKVGRSERDEKVRSAAQLLKLAALVDRYPSELSGGQRQRVALARAIAIRPAVLLLDEPMAALDRQLRAEMQFELRSLQRDVGITTIFVTHDQEEALSLSDRIAVMSEGRIVQTARSDVVYDNPATRFVAEFIGVANFFAGTVVDSFLRSSVLSNELPLDSPHPPGPVDIMIRPEWLRLTPPPGTSPSAALVLSIVNVIFVGSSVRCQAATPCGQSVRIDIPASEPRRPALGDKITAYLCARDVRVFPCIGERSP